MPTDRQIARLYTLASRAGLTHAAVKSELDTRYGAASSRDLQDFQYEQYCTDLTRRHRPTEGTYRAGAYASLAHLHEYAQSLVAFGKLWRREATEQDGKILAVVLDDFRNYRVRDARLSQRQLDTIVAKLAAFPLEIFRRAAAEWLAKHRDMNEKYFLGIMKGMTKDDARHQARAAQPGGLQRV